MVPQPDGGERLELTTPLLGLYGSVSPLPTVFTERLLTLDEESLSRGFLDIFHHRLLSLLFRALTKYRPAFASPGGPSDLAAHRLAALVGLPPAEAPGAAVRSDSLLCYAGILARQPRGAETLEHILSDRFGVDCEVEQCIGRWTALPAEQTCRLGQANSGLGRDCTVGDRVFSRSTAFRVHLGPLPWQELERYHPGGDRHAELRELVRAIDGQALDCEVELIIELASVPPAKLGDSHTRLGWTTRLDGHTDGRTTTTFLLH
jgi:type VI secretion system protein ImpH